jgi:thiol:disulfide interchange protein
MPAIRFPGHPIGLLALLLLTSSPVYAATGAGDTSLALILVFAFLGGLVLNLMPCVLPVLSLKVLSVLDSGAGPARARGHALWYTAGVMSSFALVGMLVIILQSTGRSLGWGFQLQQPLFVAALVWVMALIGLSLAGMFTLGSTMGARGQQLLSKPGHAGDFWTGALACLVASPCVAPFMGPALAYAFTAPWPVALSIFLMLGLGLAAPFLLIGFVPALARFLPRPGAWMETLKVILAFPMLLTAVWLLWLFVRQQGVDAAALALAGVVVLALGLWQFERTRWTSTVGKWVGGFIMAASLVLVGTATRLPAPDAGGTKPSAMHGATTYSVRDLAQARKEGRQVLVAITADWCITCIANEQTVLGRKGFREALERTGTVYMKGDWTNSDPVVGEFLKQHNAAGVPLYVLYRGADDSTIQILPQVLTLGIVEEALQKPGDASSQTSVAKEQEA